MGAMTPPPVTKSAFRIDIQALRAIAVTGVVLYHFWPNRLPGGYVGVDVFFVISGFLITSHLYASSARHGIVRLREFWAKRIRRLLPAAMLVIIATVGASAIWVPQTYWRQYAIEAIASTAYVQNWVLANGAVDYLGAENDPTAFQHYWSLSVEEQFYIIWPLVLVCALGVARKYRLPSRNVFLGALSVIFLVSLAFSVAMVWREDATAYFATHSRAWEFAAGGIVALVPQGLGERRRVDWPLVFALGGWIAIAAVFVAYSETTPFPGLAALLPVGATAAILWARESRVSGRILGWRPIQFVGDNSYSIYLWHWPVVVILPFALEGPRTLAISLAAISFTILVSYATRRWIEDPVRFSGHSMLSPKRIWPIAGAATLASLSIPLFVLISNFSDVAESDREIIADSNNSVCFGAAFYLSGVDHGGCEPSPLGDVLVPSLAGLKEDTGDAYRCYNSDPEGAPVGELPGSCTYGSDRADAVRVAIAGNSHAASLLPGLVPLLDEANWSLDVFVSRGCTWAPVTEDDACRNYRAEVNRRLTSGIYDVILYTERRLTPDSTYSSQGRADDLVSVWSEAARTGAKVVAIADNPWVVDSALACLEHADGFGSASECVMSAQEAFEQPDPVKMAALASKGDVGLVDLADAYCRGGQCPMVIGNVAVYRDAHHITATYSETLGRFLLDRIEKELSR